MPKLKYAFECTECELCGELWCNDCEEHYVYCKCVGPHEECENCNYIMEDCECQKKTGII